MLHINDRKIRLRADSDTETLDRFMAANPLLKPVEWNGRGILCNEFWHFAFQSHREYIHGQDPRCCDSRIDANCLTDHNELWQHIGTGDLVHIAHPYCDGADEGFQTSEQLVRDRGLCGYMSKASWYMPEMTSLVIIARPRTMELIKVEDDFLTIGEWDDWNTKKIVAAKQAVEQVDADEWLTAAESTAVCGDYYYAALLFLDAAYQERTGQFHRQAVSRLREVGALLKEHYDDVIRLVTTRSSITNEETRLVFKFAGMEVPDWLKQIWRNQRRSNSWHYREEGNYNSPGYAEFYRCLICAEWLSADERIYFGRLNGFCHKDIDCLSPIAGIPRKPEQWHAYPTTVHNSCREAP